MGVIQINNTILVVNFLNNRKFIKNTKILNRKDTTIITPISDYEILGGVNLNGNIYIKKTKPPMFYGRISFLKKKVSWNFLKFKYHGKGYKIKKFNKFSKLSFRFGKSHWTKVLYSTKGFMIRRIKKNSYCILKTGIINIFKWNRLMQDIKGVNKYTKRGVRLTRSKLKRRFGKVSQATSVYK